MSRAAVAVVVLVSVVFVGGFVLACTGVRWGSLCRVGVGLGVGCGGVRLLAAMGEGCAHICSHGQKSVRTQLAGLRVRNNGANEDTRRQRGPRHKREPNQRAWVGGLLTPDGCIDKCWYLEWSPACGVGCVRYAHFTWFRHGVGLGWGLCTVWWQVCAHGGGMGRVVGGAGGGVKRQWSGTPSWGERGACVAPIGVVGGFGEYAGWRSERSERSPLLGVLVASLGGSAGPDWYPRQRGALAGRPLGVRSGCQQGAHAWVCAR